MRLIVGVVFSLVAANVTFSQEVGVVDLSRPASVDGGAQERGPLSLACTEETRGIMANGTMKPDDNQPRKISVEIVKLDNGVLEVGSEGRAEVRLKNIGDRPIRIPWSTDLGILQQTPNPDHREWEQGAFRVVLIDEQNHTIVLKSTERWLLGLQFVSGSQITIGPGEWITASLTFRAENLYDPRGLEQFPVGRFKLFLEWEQAVRTWDRRNCVWDSGWFEYGPSWYTQEHPLASVDITKPRSNKSNNLQ